MSSEKPDTTMRSFGNTWNARTLTIGVAEDLLQVVYMCVDQTAPDQVKKRLILDTAKWIDDLLLSLSKKKMRSGENYWKPMSSRNGRHHYPCVFGRTRINVNNVSFHITTKFSQAERAIPRTLDALIKQGVIEFEKAQRGKTSMRYRLSPFICCRIMTGYEEKDQGEPRFLSLQDYAEVVLALGSNFGSKDVGTSFERMSENLPNTKRSLGKLLGNDLSEINQEIAGEDGKTAYSKYVELESRQDFVPLSFTDIDKAISVMLREHFKQDCENVRTKKGLTAVRKYYRNVVKQARSGVDMLNDVRELSERDPMFRKYSTHLVRRLGRVLSVIRSVYSVLDSGRSYYNIKNRKVYYKPRYRAAVQGGRQFEERGGVQNLACPFKLLIVGDRVKNYDINHCHLSIVQNLIHKHDLENVCPLLIKVENVSEDLTAEFKVYCNSRFEEIPGRTLDKGALLAHKLLNAVEEHVSTFPEIIKILLYATLNNGSSMLAEFHKADAFSQIQDEIQKFNVQDPYQTTKVILHLWNDFCEDSGVFSVFKKLTEIYIGQAFIENCKLELINVFGVEQIYELNEDGLLSQKDQKRVLNHIVTGYEVQMIYDFVTLNDLRVYFFEHDGLMVPADSKLGDFDINSKISEKPIADQPAQIF